MLQIQSYQLREITAQDIDEFYAILADKKVKNVFENVGSKQEALDLLNKQEKESLYAILLENQIIGYFIYQKYDQESMRLDIALKEEYSHQNIARTILKEVTDITLEKGYDCVIESDYAQSTARNIGYHIGYLLDHYTKDRILIRKKHNHG